ncbi:MAG TPA: phosphoribosylformylglycinamidine synthase subunit PurL [Thermomicrobiales bacterium]|nr:phosphoribosylformylglycinamidine synthase subunit PurL [Thermomicrobiales bacterium]
MTEAAAKSKIAPGAWREVALSDDEYARILDLLETREPTPVELGMFGSMWSEHCGYKHTRPILGRLPTKADWVLQGPGENAGAIDIGDGLAAVFKVESHNHPSAVEPYEGAATGVGGIVRDIFTMGARPIAILNSLRFGPLDQPRNVYLFENVVAGIGGYGNCLGIPTVGGDVFFDPSYSGNPLVNAMCIGIVKADGIVRAKASGVGNLIMLIGADTGRDGLHGATFASVDDPEASHRGVIQVGNPFLEKLLLEACLELLQTGAVVAMQDLGAAGLTSSTVEIASRGGVGAEIDVARVPRRESGMTPYEVMMSESQERMLLVVTPEAAAEVDRIVTKWSLHSAVIGTVTADGMVRVLDDGEVVAEIPAEFYTEACPTYIREATESPEIVAARNTDPRRHDDITIEQIGEILLDLLASPNIGSRRPVYEQYDHTIQTNTVVPPGVGDAAVLRIKGSRRGIASAIDCNPRYCYLDPYLGALHAVAEASRNVSCSGATPRGATNCLNFGNPQKPAGYYQLDRAVSGLADACRALDVPMVGGNVSLYNETASAPIKPNPAVGIVGVFDDVTRHATMQWSAGQELYLLGAAEPTLGGSEYLSNRLGEVSGNPPGLDLSAEARVQRATRKLIEDGLVATAHDVSLGGIAVALAKMAVVSNCGATIDKAGILQRSSRADEAWFGETASEIIVAIDPSSIDRLIKVMQESDVPYTRIGTAGGAMLTLGPITLDVSVLRAALDRALELPDITGTA